MNPDSPNIPDSFKRAKQARQVGDIDAAIALFRQTLREQPTFVPAYNNLANTLQVQGQYAEAVALYQQALQLAPHRAVLHCNLASLQQLQGDNELAIAGYRRALAFDARFVLAQHNLAKALAATEQFSAAESAFQAALNLQPSAEIHCDLGHLYQRRGFVQNAIGCYRAAIACQPDSAAAYNNLGAALQLFGELNAAQACYRKVLRLEPDHALAHFNLGQALEAQGKLEPALAHYQQALAQDPSAMNVLYHLNYLRLKLVDWQDYEARLADLIARTETHLADDNPQELMPMILAAFPVPSDLLKRVAAQRSQLQAKMVDSLQTELPPPKPNRAGRLRLGYVSPDFRHHAVGDLIQAIFQYHDRSVFEIFAYSLVPPQDDCSERIRQGCDYFVELWQQSPLAIAQRIRADGIDILIDLGGHTSHTCTALFALRPAPLQLQYLGYPSTMGADYIPYIIADAQLIPPSLADNYSEQVLYLPNAWVASTMPIAQPPSRRADYGLPENAFVFCCFNSVYKIDPSVFAVWLVILAQVDNSVLWLYDGDSALVVERLKQRAKDAGIAPERLIFVSRQSHDRYLANYQLADLFLDTFVYNAGATAVDALSAGLPVLTCPKENYAARMGASLLHAVGLPELICDSTQHYQQRAIELARNSQTLRELKSKLASAKSTAPLFQPPLFVQNLETALRELWQKNQPTLSETTMTTSQENHSVIMQGSAQLSDWLREQNISFAFTTYQTNRLFLVGRKEDGRLAINERLFDKPMGLYAQGNRLYMGTRYQIWQLENRLADGEQQHGCDRLYVPSRSYTTGDLNVHDVVMVQKRLLFINTDFSCLATLQDGYSFTPLWKPPFISKLAAEDRCHLNGLAMQNGQPTYVTACSRSDDAAGWRNHRVDGGIVMHIPSNEIVLDGLSMPHSPRYYRGKLWLLNSGTGEFGYVDKHQFVPVTFCAGFVRGLAFWQDYALVGLSKLRSTSFGGLELEKRLAADGNSAQCGLMVIDLRSGEIVHWLHIASIVEELFDVVILPNVQQPRALGFQDDDIDRFINFPQSGGLLITKPTVKRPSLSTPAQVAGLPRIEQLAPAADAAIKYQRVFHLTPDNLIPYDALTYPSLKQRWQTQPQRGELLGVSASVDGEMIGFAVAEQWSENGETQAEMLSLFVLPAYQQRGIEQKLMAYLQRG